MIRAYHSLANATDRAAVTREQVQAAEDAVIDIVLLGKKAEIRAVEGIESTRDEGGTFSLKPVTEALRTSLRHELQLPPVGTRAMYLRWAPTNLSPSKPLDVSVVLAAHVAAQNGGATGAPTAPATTSAPATEF